MSNFGSSAYGGAGWSERTASHRAEIGTLWRGGIDSEWRRLKTVLLCRPGAELAVNDANANQFLEPLDLGRAQAEHDRLAEIYRAEGIETLVTPEVVAPPPNRMFCADQMVLTPEGAILARPASTVRAGEEIAVAMALANHQVPILKTLTGHATFEGADLMWLDADTAIIGRGLRTNQLAIEQITALLAEIGCTTLAVDMPFGTMHLMGMLRIADEDLAIAWPRRTPHAAVTVLRDRGMEVAFLPNEDEAAANRGLNFVTLGPRRILMLGNNATMRAFYERLGIEVLETPMDELKKAAGAIGCLTGVIGRAQA